MSRGILPVRLVADLGRYKKQEISLLLLQGCFHGMVPTAYSESPT